MAAVLRRTPAKRRGQSTQVTARDLALLEHDIAGANAIYQDPLSSRKSDLSTATTTFTLWTPSPPLPNVESSHILDELVSSETSYLEELRSIYATIIRPHRESKFKLEDPVLALLKNGANKPGGTKRHGRSQSLFSLKSSKESLTSTPSKALVDRLKDPMQPDSDHLERAYWSIESMIKSHSAMLSAFKDSRNAHELISAFIIHVESLLLTYRAYVLTLPYISNLLPAANGAMPNKLSGYSRFLGPMQRSIKYELLLRRLVKALFSELASIELQKLAKLSLRVAERFCQTLESAQKSEQARIYLGELSSRLGVDLKHKTLLFEGSLITEALSSKKGCKINYAILFTDGTIFWNSTPAAQERTIKSWVIEKVVRVEEGGCLDLVVHSTLQKSDKLKEIRRAVGFTTVTTPIATTIPDRTPEKRRMSSNVPTSAATVEMVVDIRGEKRRRKETVVEDWVSLGRVREKDSQRFSLGGANSPLTGNSAPSSPKKSVRPHEV